MRPKKLTGDNVPIRDIVDFIKRNNLNHSKFNFSLSCCTTNKIKDLIKHIKNKDLNYDLLISIKKFEKSPERAFIIKNNKKLVLDKIKHKRSQDLKLQYFD